MSATAPRLPAGSIQPAGLYVHVPFCLQKCAYCDFYSVTDLSRRADYLGALRREMKLVAARGLIFDSLYIGGGTPSLLAPAEVAAVLAAAQEAFAWREDVEITLEANPCSLTPEGLAGYLQAGVNRLQIGVQSFQDDHLAWLGRLHGAAAARQAVKWARAAGFENVGLDLIFGIPGQSWENWRADLEQAAALEVAHISCYMLSFEPGTPLDRRRQEGKLRPATAEAISRLYELAVAFLASHGYAQYEVSNFARSQEKTAQRWRSRHNQKYWSGAPYIGLGPAAHSFVGRQRCWNHRSLRRYLGAVAAGRQPVAGRETLSPLQRQIEAIYTGLRTNAGIDLARYNKAYSPPFEKHFAALLSRLAQAGLAVPGPRRCALTPRGMLLLDSIAEQFVSLL
ncbi:MAG: radical SAM family heme chaperone HemW [Desulfobacteraceae bacterium]|jgi:oxygen-independent coproporphyrinogen-3 oxidase|nr:radical SAM family heme chaperone HemW [Desulfobacteraceae bacterium]